MSAYDREHKTLIAYGKHCNITRGKISEDRFNEIDFKFVSGSSWCALESKVRVTTLSTYDSYFIEKPKFDTLKKYYEKGLGIVPLYLNYFASDNSCYIWDLTRFFEGEELKFYELDLPSKTSTIEHPNGAAKKIKLVADLPTSHVTYKYKFSI